MRVCHVQGRTFYHVGIRDSFPAEQPNQQQHFLSHAESVRTQGPLVWRDTLPAARPACVVAGGAAPPHLSGNGCFSLSRGPLQQASACSTNRRCGMRPRLQCPHLIAGRRLWPPPLPRAACTSSLFYPQNALRCMLPAQHSPARLIFSMVSAAFLLLRTANTTVARMLASSATHSCHQTQGEQRGPHVTPCGAMHGCIGAQCAPNCQQAAESHAAAVDRWFELCWCSNPPGG